MDIKNLPNHPNGNIKGLDSSDQSQRTHTPSGKPSESTWSDKVSLEHYSFRNNEELFAKSELDKFNKKSFDKLKKVRAELTEYESAKEISPEAAEETEMGKRLSSPAVLETIARRMADS